MANNVVTTTAEIRAALQQAKQTNRQPRLKGIRYNSALDVFILLMSDDSRHFIPRERLEGLATATKKQLGNIEILGPGTGIHWPDLDLSFGVEELFGGVFGTKNWMAELGRRGGSVISTAKTEAARLNGKKGGRPPLLLPAVRQSASSGSGSPRRKKASR